MHQSTLLVFKPTISSNLRYQDPSNCKLSKSPMVCSAISCGTSVLSSIHISLAGAILCIKALCLSSSQLFQGTYDAKTLQIVTITDNMLSNLMWNFGSFFNTHQLGWSEFYASKHSACLQANCFKQPTIPRPFQLSQSLTICSAISCGTSVLPSIHIGLAGASFMHQSTLLAVSSNLPY